MSGFKKFFQRRPAQAATTSAVKPTIVWQPSFSHSIPVSQEWEHKIGHGSDGWGNQEVQYYTDSRENSLHTERNTLLIRAISSSAPTSPYPQTSARLVSHRPLSSPTGHLSCTLTLPLGNGIWPAFWLLPSEPFSWPDEGEIDLAETWNGSGINGSCLHWGTYDGSQKEREKHRVIKTKLPHGGTGRIKYDFYWSEPDGKLVWCIDDRAVMRSSIPPGLRPLSEWKILLNVAMGGNVCDGQVPAKEGNWDMEVDEIWIAKLDEKVLDRLWREAPEGKPLQVVELE